MSRYKDIVKHQKYDEMFLSVLEQLDKKRRIEQLFVQSTIKKASLKKKMTMVNYLTSLSLVEQLQENVKANRYAYLQRHEVLLTLNDNDLWCNMYQNTHEIIEEKTEIIFNDPDKVIN